jgi:hypothetical protein
LIIFSINATCPFSSFLSTGKPLFTVSRGLALPVNPDTSEHFKEAGIGLADGFCFGELHLGKMQM